MSEHTAKDDRFQLVDPELKWWVQPYDPFRPIAPEVKWWIVGVVVLILGAWELAFHLWFMGLPMITGHRLNALIAAALVTSVVVAFFRFIQGYERQVAAAARALAENNKELRSGEQQHDLRLLDLTRDLALALVQISNECEIALTGSVLVDARKTLASVRARAQELFGVERALVDLEQEGAALADRLPPILADHEQCQGTVSTKPVVKDGPQAPAASPERAENWLSRLLCLPGAPAAGTRDKRLTVRNRP